MGSNPPTKVVDVLSGKRGENRGGTGIAGSRCRRGRRGRFREERRGPLVLDGDLIGHEHLPFRADADVAEVPAHDAGDVFLGEELTDQPQPEDRGADDLEGAVLVMDEEPQAPGRPSWSPAGCDRRLVVGFRDVGGGLVGGQGLEGQPAVGAQGHLYELLGGVERADEQVPEAVERHARVAEARHEVPVAVGDVGGAPRHPAVERHALDHRLGAASASGTVAF